jgi:hypothetical protein
MAAFGSSDVNVVLLHRRYLAGGKGQWMSAGVIQFGDGSLTYPTGGIPLPAPSKFGFANTIVYMQVEGPILVGTSVAPPASTTAFPTVAPTAGFYRAGYVMGTNTLQLLAVPALGTTAPLAQTEIAATVAPTLSAYQFVAFGA